jgi:hypothetical protein
MSKSGRSRAIQAYWKHVLPYGKWTCVDGREVLFNREYRPILQRRPNGPVEVANPSERVRFNQQIWFYQDEELGGRSTRGPSKRLLKRINDALAAWSLCYEQK